MSQSNLECCLTVNLTYLFRTYRAYYWYGVDVFKICPRCSVLSLHCNLVYFDTTPFAVFHLDQSVYFSGSLWDFLSYGRKLEAPALVFEYLRTDIYSSNMNKVGLLHPTPVYPVLHMTVYKLLLQCFSYRTSQVYITSVSTHFHERTEYHYFIYLFICLKVLNISAEEQTSFSIKKLYSCVVNMFIVR